MKITVLVVSQDKAAAALTSIKLIPAGETLTAREEEVLELIAAGLSNKEIGRQLKISVNTVKTHLHRVYVKLNKSGRYKALLAQGSTAGRVENDVSSPLMAS